MKPRSLQGCFPHVGRGEMETGSATPFICSKLIITPINVTMTRSSNNTSCHALSVHPLPGPKGTELVKASCCLHRPRGLDAERQVNTVVILRWEKGWAKPGAESLRKESREAFQEAASELSSRGSTDQPQCHFSCFNGLEFPHFFPCFFQNLFLSLGNSFLCVCVF